MNRTRTAPGTATELARVMFPRGPVTVHARRAGCQVTGYPDGPFIVRGSFELHDPAGRPIAVRRRTVAVCRCGRTRAAPFCDGTHKAIRFRAAATPPVPGNDAGAERAESRHAA
jgi:CDGSH-type Zn-finger protein